MATGELRKRTVWIDALKGLASLAVVLGHVTASYLDRGQFAQHRNILLWLFNGIYAFHMPLFFIISGFVFALAYSCQDGTLKSPGIKLQIANMLILYFLWNILFGAGKILFSAYVANPYQLSSLLWVPLRAVDLSWYLYVLIFCYLLTLLVWNKAPAAALFVVSMVCCLIRDWSFLPISSITLFSVPMYYVFFLFGFLLQQHPAALDKLSKPAAVLLNFAAGAGILCVWQLTVKPGESFPWSGIPFVGALMAFALSASLIGLFKKLSAIASFRVLSLIGFNSLEIYVMHPFVLKLMRLILPRLGITGFCVSILLCFLVSSAAPILVSSALKKAGLHNMIFRPATCFWKKRINLLSANSH